MSTRHTRSVVLLSGGLDSTTLLAERRSEGRVVLPIAFNYSQRHLKELEAADDVAKHYGLTLKVVNLQGLYDVVRGASSQTGDDPVPHGHYADESMRVTVVPNRNMTFLAVATAYAIAQGAAEICYAAHAGDHAIYPDCRPQFADAMRLAIALCDYPERTPILVTPFVRWSKASIVAIGADMKVPYELTYSCYEGRLAHCGLCGTCVERKEAFVLASVPDPTVYES
jgi:7-cyano-7-deazaguanine synthase